MRTSRPIGIIGQTREYLMINRSPTGASPSGSGFTRTAGFYLKSRRLKIIEPSNSVLSV